MQHKLDIEYKFIEFMLFDKLENTAYAVSEEYFKKTNLVDFEKRLQEGRFIGVGTQRLMIHTLYRLLGGDVESLVMFYRNAHRAEDDPHYEDIVTAVIINIVCGIIVNIIWANKDNPRTKNIIDDVKNRTRQSTIVLVRLIKQWRLRGEFWANKINKKEYNKQLQLLNKEFNDEIYNHRSVEDVTSQNEIDVIINQLSETTKSLLIIKPEIANDIVNEIKAIIIRVEEQEDIDK